MFFLILHLFQPMNSTPQLRETAVVLVEKEEETGELSENDEVDVEDNSDHKDIIEKISPLTFLGGTVIKYSVVSIKQTGCNKRTGWSKNLI